MSGLNDSPASLIQKLLVAASLGVNPPSSGWPIYIGRLPDMSNVESEILSVADTEPITDGRLMAGKRIVHYGIQVRIRANEYATGYTKAAAITAFLDTVKNNAVTGDSTSTYKVHAVSIRGDILPIGTDQEGREHFTVNATCSIT